MAKINLPLPSSPNLSPYPPHCTSLRSGFINKQLEPVPDMRTIPPVQTYEPYG